jgi:glycosyltransferase involved in cell wall biosynthesis
MQKICIVIPCYNEAERLPRDDYIQFYQQNENIHFCFVNDGSTDNTKTVLSELQKQRERIRIINLETNQGKAEAVRTGMLDAFAQQSFDMIGYFDADLATPLEEVFLLAKAMSDDPDYLVSFGSRVQRLGSTIIRNPARHYFGRVFSTVASIILKIPVYDTQCGAKLFRPENIKKIFQDPFLSTWLFDLEIFARYINTFGRDEVLERLIEVPLTQWIL